MGIDAAMMVTALSAAPHITSSTVSMMSKAPMAVIVLILINETTPALEHIGQWLLRAQTLGLEMLNAHKTPMLIASETPNFSFFVIERPQIIFHGRIASTMSMAPEYDAVNVL